MKKLTFGLLTLLASPAAWSQNQPAFNAEYSVTFTSTWSANTHPVGFPSDPHFSGLVGTTHAKDVHLWEMGGMATAGIRSMAETGSKFPLTNEINALINDGLAQNLLSGGGIGTSPGQVSLVFDTSQQNPYVSLVSMIAPSPDWFVGVDGLNLRENGQWQEQITVDLHAYDAGTDSGASYTSPNLTSNPQETITRINDSPFNTNPVLGQFVFELLSTSGNFPLGGEHSGLYLDPANSGDGISLIISESEGRNFALVTWYTYRNGQQMWLAGSVDFDQGDAIAEIEVFRTTGANFGMDFNGNDVEVFPWGTLTVSIPDCGLLKIEYEGTENLDEVGEFTYSQLANVGTLSCG